jgi:hypothetical protein
VSYSEYDQGFAFLLNRRDLFDFPADPRYPFGRAFVSPEVRGFIMKLRLMFPGHVYDDGYYEAAARNAQSRAIAAYFEAGDWIRAKANPELSVDERHEWQMNANVLEKYAEAMLYEERVLRSAGNALINAGW